jgi:hypothetical protein
MNALAEMELKRDFGAYEDEEENVAVAPEKIGEEVEEDFF